MVFGIAETTKTDYLITALFIFRQNPSRLAVRVGNYHLYEEDPSQRDIAVSAVHLHPEYSTWTTENDICLLDLAEEADLSDPNIGRGHHSRSESSFRFA